MMNKELLKKIRDHKFYLENFCRVKTKEVGMQPFILNEAQKDFFNAMRMYRKIIILKARQLGFSTAVTAFFYVDTIMRPGITTALIGYNSDMVTELLDKIKTFYRTTPINIRPTIQYDSKFQMSFPSMDSKILVLPNTKDVGRGYTIHNCLHGNTKILTTRGRYKEIKNIIKGDIVLSGTGGHTKVIRTSKINNTKRVLRIKAYGHYDDLIVTEDHKVLCREKKTGKDIWKNAGDLIGRNDFIAYPYFQCRNRYKKIEINNFIKDGYKSRSNNCPRSIRTNYEFGLFVGWYLAEGHINSEKNRIIMCINEDEIDEVMNVINPFRKFFGKIRTRTRHNTKSTTITLEGTNFASFICSIFGRTDSKNINDCVWYWGWDFCKGLIFGLFSGDGCFKNDKYVVLTNTNEAMLNQTKKMLVSLRIGLGVIRKAKSYRYDKECKDRFDYYLGGKGNYKFRRIFNLDLPIYDNGRARWSSKNHKERNQGGGYWKRGKNFYWSKVYEVIEEYNVEHVYDIEVEDKKHFFSTVNGVVHNCLITELSSWDDANEKFAGLMESVVPNGRVIIESTPRGQGNLYHRLWMTDNEFIKKDYGWWWGYTKEQMDKKRATIGERMWSQEYGLEFLATGRNVFDLKMIREMRKQQLKVGDKNEPKHSGQEEFIVREEEDWVVYREPEADGLYVCSGDVAEGVEGGDYSVATIWDRKTGEEVAMYRGLIPPDRFGNLLDKWGRKYNNALMAIEINNHGLTTVTVLRQKIYPSLYFRPSKFETIGLGTTDRIGWKTTKVTRPLLIDELAMAVREGSLTIHSKKILDEMSVFIYNDNGDMVPQPGFHDDTIFSSGIALQAFKNLYHKKLTQIDESKHLPVTFSY